MRCKVTSQKRICVDNTLFSDLVENASIIAGLCDFGFVILRSFLNCHVEYFILNLNLASDVIKHCAVPQKLQQQKDSWNFQRRLFYRPIKDETFSSVKPPFNLNV